ncbi:MAG: polyprenyl diphosphate synthase [Actinomycetales bacterium]|jgi:short-chain Z-isoprenyl diphosphate synthase
MARLRSLIKSAIYPIYERRLLSDLDLTKTPQHVGLILDGNRRWSRENPSPTGDISSKRGHLAGAEKILELMDWCEATDIKVVTLWLLSSDNFKRETAELDSLYQIIWDTVAKLQATGRWKIRPMGSFELLPNELQNKLRAVETQTKAIDGITVNVAIGYGGRLEIIDAVKRYFDDAILTGKNPDQIKESITAEQIDRYLYTAGQPEPELVIRTSGEQRLGGFLLWQSHQSEFYFCEAYWPDFRKVDFLRALRSFAQRERRLGR